MLSACIDSCVIALGAWCRGEVSEMHLRLECQRCFGIVLWWLSPRTWWMRENCKRIRHLYAKLRTQHLKRVLKARIVMKMWTPFGECWPRMVRMGATLQAPVTVINSWEGFSNKQTNKQTNNKNDGSHSIISASRFAPLAWMLVDDGWEPRTTLLQLDIYPIRNSKKGYTQTTNTGHFDLMLFRLPSYRWKQKPQNRWQLPCLQQLLPC